MYHFVILPELGIYIPLHFVTFCYITRIRHIHSVTFCNILLYYPNQASTFRYIPVMKQAFLLLAKTNEAMSEVNTDEMSRYFIKALSPFSGFLPTVNQIESLNFGYIFIVYEYLGYRES